jgi:arylsulfatase A-like enzyme
MLPMRKQSLLGTFVIFFTLATALAEARKPNLVFILTDNHGAWTLGCYGNKEIRTPNIDRLAAEGIRFTRAYCNNSVCSPSRATFLTGLIPSQNGVHSYLPAETALSPSGPEACQIHEFASLPKVLSKAGYVCGLAGKWHLGGNLQPQEGFSYWFTKASGHTASFYHEKAIWQGKIYNETNYFTDVITDHAVDFLEQNQAKPFFLYLCYNGPYGLGGALTETPHNRHAAYYADKPMESFPRAEVSPWLKSNRNFVNNVESMRHYAAAVSGVDDGIGRVMETLKRLKLDDNTLVVFAGDQGLNAGHGGYWGMGDHSRPLNTREATVRIPLIYRQPGQIPAGKTSEAMTCNYDFLPTVLDYLGLAEKIPTQPALPGKSYAAALKGKTLAWQNTIYHEFENTRMIRTPEWKLTLRYPNGPDEFYNMALDPEESKNLIHVSQFAGARNKLQQQLEAFFARYADPQYDLWKSGKSKAPRRTK